MKSKYIKLLALIMVLCMCLFTAGCGGSENDGGEEAADQEAGQETVRVPFVIPEGGFYAHNRRKD